MVKEPSTLQIEVYDATHQLQAMPVIYIPFAFASGSKHPFSDMSDPVESLPASFEEFHASHVLFADRNYP
jgi:hypothetical protein